MAVTFGWSRLSPPIACEPPRAAGLRRSFSRTGLGLVCQTETPQRQGEALGP